MVNCNHCGAPIFRMNFHEFLDPDDLEEFKKEHTVYSDLLYFCSEECIEEFGKTYLIKEVD